MEDTRTEPSMEDILASIKRIIADDTPPTDGTPPHVGRADRDGEDRDDDDRKSGDRTEDDRVRDDALPALLDETPAVDTPAPVIADALPEPAPPAAPAVAPAPPAPAIATPTAVAAAAAPVAEAPPAAAPAPAPAAPSATLVSAGAASASRQSLSALSSMVVRPASGDITLDGLVRELIRPMLTEWLDSHLPAVVEKLVAREIARITAEQA